MVLLNFAALLATCLLPAQAGPKDPAALASRENTLIPQNSCGPGQCCEFKLRIYQRCIYEDPYHNRVQTWPLFYDFVQKDRTPITPITGDYNTKALLPSESKWASVGNITGPNDFYMRWQFQQDLQSGDKLGRDIMTYWFGGIDHSSQNRCKNEKLTEYSDNLKGWIDACTPANSMIVNRTRMREAVCPFEC